MTTPRIEDFGHQFPDNGLKLLQQGPLNLRDLFQRDVRGNLP